MGALGIATFAVFVVAFAWLCVCVWQFGQLDASGKTSMSPGMLWWLTVAAIVITFVGLVQLFFIAI